VEVSFEHFIPRASTRVSQQQQQQQQQQQLAHVTALFFQHVLVAGMATPASAASRTTMVT
jgi:hypothetical protein